MTPDLGQWRSTTGDRLVDVEQAEDPLDGGDSTLQLGDPRRQLAQRPEQPIEYSMKATSSPTLIGVDLTSGAPISAAGPGRTTASPPRRWPPPFDHANMNES